MNLQMNGFFPQINWQKTRDILQYYTFIVIWIRNLPMDYFGDML